MLLFAPALSLALSVSAQAAPAPCNPDSMKSIGCVASRYYPAPKAQAKVPMVCNHDPLKGAACHAHIAQARAEKRKDEQLASAAE